MPADMSDEDLPLPELAPPGLWWRLSQRLRHIRGRRRNEPGFSMRVEWPRGEHDFVGFDSTAAAAERRVAGYYKYWATAPYRPTSITIVAISRHDRELHGRRRRCCAPDCPDGTEQRLAQDGADPA